MGTSERDANGGDAHDALQRDLLLIVATQTLRRAAAPGQFDAEVSDEDLREAMVRAYHAAKAVSKVTGVGEKFGYRLGASAAVTLIRDAGSIFPVRIPDPGEPLGDFAYRGYLAGAAFTLAISVTECFAEVILPVWSQTEARDNFLDHVNEIIEDPQYTQRNAVTALVECLREFQEAGDQLAPGPPPPPGPHAPPARSREWWHLGAAVAATIAVFALMQWLIPPIPRAFVKNATTISTTGALSADPIPPLPNAPTTVPLAQTLPNTRVQLFAFVRNPSAAPDAQTVPGLLPQVAAPVMRINDHLVFQLWLSVRDKAVAPDQLSLSVGATSPTSVSDSHLMLDRYHEGDVEPHLDSGDFVPVRPIAKDGAPTIYQFILNAPPDRLAVGYWCGYNAKPVQILVSTNDNAVAATTTYPVYVLRDKDC
ncbi:MAG TPA: hypothetical protein VMU34_08490 [Mycobacterium sp.]|nr:hypothetical protein [Mycobacterium sp.]